MENWDVRKLCFWIEGDNLASIFKIGDNFAINVEFKSSERMNWI
jgi:hypothetical protein